MESSKNLSPSPTEIIDWLNDEGLLDLEWDFPEDGDLAEAGLDENVISHLLPAIEDEFGVELGPEDLVPGDPVTPMSLAAMIASRM